MAQGERWLALADASQLPADLRARRAAGRSATSPWSRATCARAVEPLDGAVRRPARSATRCCWPGSLDPWPGLPARRPARRGPWSTSTRRSRGRARRRRPTRTTPAAGRALLGMLDNERGEILDDLGSVAEARALFEAYRQQAHARRGPQPPGLGPDQPGPERVRPRPRTRGPGAGRQALAAADEGGSTPIQGDARMAAGLVEVLVGDPAPGRRATRPRPPGCCSPPACC